MIFSGVYLPWDILGNGGTLMLCTSTRYMSASRSRPEVPHSDCIKTEILFLKVA